MLTFTDYHLLLACLDDTTILTKYFQFDCKGNTMIISYTYNLLKQVSVVV